MDKLEKILRKYLNNGSDRIDVTMVLALIQQCKKDTKEQLTLTDVSQQRKFIKKWWKYFDEESVAINCNDEEREEVITNFFNCG